MTCEHFNLKKVECAKGTDCDCARECADENIYDVRRSELVKVTERIIGTQRRNTGSAKIAVMIVDAITAVNTDVNQWQSIKTAPDTYNGEYHRDVWVLNKRFKRILLIAPFGDHWRQLGDDCPYSHWHPQIIPVPPEGMV